MHWSGRHLARWRPRRAAWPASVSRIANGAVLATALLMPSAQAGLAGAAGSSTAGSSTTTGSLAAGSPAAASTRGRPFTGTPAVGALFTVAGSKLSQHFCSASVVHSSAGNLILTAAHCLGGRPVGGPRGIVFAPGWHDGHAPHGIWPVTAVFVSHAWSARRAPSDDVAFLQVGPDRQPGHPGQAVEQVTGSERLGTGLAPQRVEVVGYPDATSRPITCRGQASAFGRTQLVFRCGGYTDGTSGGPFLAHVRGTGRGTVLGVIGGFEQGGDTPEVSYSPRFGAQVAALYRAATAGTG
ncbi:MAG: trypsin-like peptidase domain-containing protein [Actinomycetota bacterium]